MVVFDPPVFPARSEQSLMSTWTEPGPPLVSICCPTYNHGRLLERTLQGLIVQQTTFPFEIIVRDDASIDNTGDILAKYSREFPRVFRVVRNSNNQFVETGTGGILRDFTRLATGRFIALCEGDDFWISETKLQKQLDLLEKFPGAVMSVAHTHVCQDREGFLEHLRTFSGNANILQYFDDITKTYFHTSTYVIRTHVFNDVVSRHFANSSNFGDTALRFCLIERGPFVQLPEVVSVYAQTGEGIWTSLDREKQQLWELTCAREIFWQVGGHRLFHGKRVLSLYLAILRQAVKKRLLSSEAAMRIVHALRFRR
jgi:glycosyltransferase involved in cell wall biosynthesis